MHFLKSIAVAALSVQAVLGNPSKIFDRVEEAKARFLQETLAEAPASSGKTSSKNLFLNSKTQPFVVNGTGIPLVDFDIGESYAGLLPISNAPGETRELFFWYFPSTNPDATNEIGIWLNGGPGCSSLSGLLTENGPFLWQAGTLAPTPNPYSWNKLTNYVWIEQPVGTGYSQGTPDITNEIELAEQFKGFWMNFVDTFSLHNYDVYVTGESYAGFYVPYIANSFILEEDSKYFNVKGIGINDPIIGNEYLQTEMPLPAFVSYWNELMDLDPTTVENINGISEQCGWTDYYNKYFTFPAQQKHFPEVPGLSCDLFYPIFKPAMKANPCFNIYHITDTCPFLYGHLGIVNRGDYEPPGGQVYFNRQDVKRAINAPLNTTWYQCSPHSVFAKHDHSPGPALDGTLQNVIQSTNNVFIGSGQLDFLLPTNGTLFALQNLTWNGHQGFDVYPSTPFVLPHHNNTNRGALAATGQIGEWTSERGLTFYIVQLSGHELPGYSLGGGYRMLETLLGRISSLGSTQPFSGM